MDVVEAQFLPDSGSQRGFDKRACLRQGRLARLSVAPQNVAIGKGLARQPIEQRRERLAPPDKSVVRIERRLEVGRRNHLPGLAEPPRVTGRIDRQCHRGKRSVVDPATATPLTLNEARQVLRRVVLVDQGDVGIVIADLERGRGKDDVGAFHQGFRIAAGAGIDGRARDDQRRTC